MVLKLQTRVDLFYYKEWEPNKANDRATIPRFFLCPRFEHTTTKRMRDISLDPCLLANANGAEIKVRIGEFTGVIVDEVDT